MSTPVSLWINSDVSLYKDILDWNGYLREWLEANPLEIRNNEELFSPAASLLAGLLTRVNHLSVEAIRIGSETCSRELPNLSIINNFLELSENTGVRLELVLPILAHAECVETDIWTFLKDIPPEINIIANDIGTVAFLRDHAKNKILAGRLLWKQKRFARFHQDEYSLLGKDILEECQIVEPPGWIKNFDVNSFEIDLLPQGLSFTSDKVDKCIGINLPWSLITYGRVCFIGSLEFPLHQKFRISSQCSHECNRFPQVYKNPEWESQLFRAGKAIYCCSNPGDYSWLGYQGLSHLILDTTKCFLSLGVTLRKLSIGGRMAADVIKLL